MRAVCLLGVLLVAKAMVLASQGAAWSAWASVAYFAPDLLVAAAAAVLDRLLRRPRLGWVVYGAAVGYIAVNVPIAIVLGSPLTLPMIRAAGGPLSDSIAFYVTAGNLARGVAVIVVGAALPLVVLRVLRDLRGDLATWTVSGLGAVALALGPIAASRVDTRGLDRNAFTAMVPISLPSVSAAPGARDWRSSPIASPDIGSPDLTAYRGAARGMNVVVVILESTAARYLRPYGAAADPMPNLTKLSERALTFEDAYAVYPESIKGLFAAMCSRYPLFGEDAEVQASMPCDPVARDLAAAGYRTALFHSGRFGYLGMDTVVQRLGFEVLEDAGAIGGHVRSSFGVDEPAAVDRMLRWIDGLTPGERFFVSYLPIAGHHPYASPQAGPFFGDTDFDRYRNALHDGDAALGRLLDGLRARGLDDRTVMVVFGDHGEAFGQHQGNVGHTMFIDDENVRVPYVIAIPGVTMRPVRVRATASLLDTAPTMLDLLGLPPAARHQGTSLLRSGSRMALYFTDYSLGWLGLRDGCWTYHLEVGSDRSQLFDVCRDATEARNVADREPRRERLYRERVKAWSGELRK